MANVLFIQFNSLPQQPGVDNINFKYVANPAAPTVLTTMTVIFGPATGTQCPISASSVDVMATNLATFLDSATATGTFAGKFTASASGDTVTVIALNSTSISNPSQPVLSTTDSTVVNKLYQKYVNGASGLYDTLPAFSFTTLGAGSTVKFYARRYQDQTSHNNFWGNNSHSDKYNDTYDSNSLGLFTVNTDTTLVDFFNTVILVSPVFAAFSSTVFSTTTFSPGGLNFRFRFQGDRYEYYGWHELEQNVKITITRKLPGAKYCVLNVTSEDGSSGIGRVVKLDTLANTVLFLTTDFLDLSGKNNQVAYRNQTWMNFDDTASTPSYSPNSVAILCKSSETSGNPVNSYQFGAAGGINTNSNIQPGWEWWDRSYFIRDSNGSSNSDTYNSIRYLINQTIDTGTVNPGTKAIES